ncbi:MAG TPA: glycoside hydrolase family 16 protein [Chitinophagaceae bacterium]|nr:glycoside hydrolase family 16 protein [Chitinophagaceae bacterium]
MRFIIITITALCLYSCATKPEKKELVWSDEFDYSGLPDSTKWGYDTGGHGWGNNELQYYTQAREANAYVSDGKLFIKAIKEDYDSSRYTSARLVSRNKGDWKYGRIEVKAKLPAGRGMWPAIWMLPTDWEYGGWPESGEIDIMEYVGFSPDSIFATVHTKAYNHSIGTHKVSGVVRKDVTSAFHVYALEWDEDLIRMFVDDHPYYEFKNEKKTSEEWPFDKRFHLLMNIAVGGNWGGKMGVNDSIFPQQMEVDYVRVYK